MKRVILGMLMVIVFGCNVQAAQFSKATPVRVGADPAETVDVKAVMSQAENNLNNARVYGVEIIMNDELLMDVAIDQNTKVIYGNIPSEDGNMILWGDTGKKMAYLYDAKTQKWYFSPNDTDFSELEKQKDSVKQTVQTENVVNYQYIGKVTKTVREQAVECYQIRATESESGEVSTCDYYVSINGNQMISTVITMQSGYVSGGVTMQMNFYYPESLSVPQNVVANATLAPGYSVVKNKVNYKVKEVKGQPVFCVNDAYRTGKNVKILDSIMVCGKAYPVYEISDAAFLGNAKVKTVTIGKNVQVIGKKAFYKCKKLSTVKINAGNLKKVGKYAFKETARSCKVKVAKKKYKKYKKLISRAKSGVIVTK